MRYTGGGLGLNSGSDSGRAGGVVCGGDGEEVGWTVE